MRMYYFIVTRQNVREDFIVVFCREMGMYAGGRIACGWGKGTCFVTGHGVRRSISFKIKIIEAAEHKTL